MEREQQGGGGRQRDVVGHIEHAGARTDRVLGVPAMGLAGDGGDPTAEQVLGAGADGVDGAEDLHAGGVGECRCGHHVAAGDAFEIVEVEWDRLDRDAHLAGARRRHLDGVELEHLEW